MNSLLTILDWSFWGIGAVYCAICFVSRPQSPGDRDLKRSMGIALAIALAVTAVLPVYKSAALVAIPIAYLGPVILMVLRAKFARLNMRGLMKESNESGVPIDDVIERKSQNSK